MLFQIHCTRDLEKLVEFQFHSFQVDSNLTESFLVRLNLKKDSALSGIEKLKVQQIPFEIRSRLARVRDWNRQQITIDLIAVHTEAISSAIGYALVAALSEARGLLLHAALLGYQKHAHIIAGASGAGKSTLAKNARKMKCIHDDKCAIRFFRGKWNAYGVPMLDNSSQVGSPYDCTIKQLLLIKKGKRISQRIIKKTELFSLLAPQVIVGQHANRKKAMQSLLDFCCDIPISELTFGKSDDVSDILLTL